VSVRRWLWLMVSVLTRCIALDVVLGGCPRSYKTIESQVTLHLPLQSIHPPVSRLEYVMSGYLLTKFEALVRSRTRCCCLPIGGSHVGAVAWLRDACR